MDVHRRDRHRRHREAHLARSRHMGIIMTGIVGIVGSFVGGYIARLFNKPVRGAPVHRAGIILSVVGALIVLFIYDKLVN
jgi:uncharacterized membrane protein YeaQ/YmgE (transglycosylase-associated protein family)